MPGFDSAHSLNHGEQHRDHDGLPPDLIRVPEAARRLGLASETLYRLIRAGNFAPAVHIGSAIRVSVPRLEAYLHGDAARNRRDAEAADAHVESPVVEVVRPSALFRGDK
jgi:excisionase family DNA binding protein